MGHMTRRHLMTLTLLLVLADAVAAAAVFVVVSTVRFESSANAVWSVGISPGAASLLFAALWVVVCWILGLYRLRVRWSLIADARDVLRATIATAAVTLSALFLFHQDDVSRLFLFALFVVQPLAATLLRAALRNRFDALGRQGRSATFMVIAGTGRLAEAFANQVERHPALGIRVIGHLTIPNATETEGARYTVSRPILGAVDEMHEIFHTRVIDEVGVCLPAEAAGFLEPIVAIAADEGKTVRVPRSPEEGVLRNALSEDFEGYLVRSVVHDGPREVHKAAKRILDLVGSIVGGVVVSPILAITAIAIWIGDGRPILFKQIRVGRHGREFIIYKFRTMVQDAEQRYVEVSRLSDTRGAAFKMTNDPRVTRVGKFIRAWTLDELPQLINVLRGDMSLVGPRPAPPREVASYDIWHRRRLSIRPGMTGLWQVEARFDRHFDDRAEMDLRYIDHWSFWTDLSILARTIPAVLLRPGK